VRRWEGEEKRKGGIMGRDGRQGQRTGKEKEEEGKKTERGTEGM